jgi:hypothetical protein
MSAMGTPGDLIEFLRARLDDDEWSARAATPGPWMDFGPHAIGVEQIGVEDAHMVAEMQRCEEPAHVHEDRRVADAQFIGDWNPARVLAEVDVKLRIIGVHGWSVEAADTAGFVCITCDPEGHPCATLRLLALPYAGHADYRPEWAPE